MTNDRAVCQQNWNRYREVLEIQFSKRRCLSYLGKMRMTMGTTFTSTAP